jgi:hypothetical protein
MAIDPTKRHLILVPASTARGPRSIDEIVREAREAAQQELTRRTYAKALLNRLSIPPFGSRLVGLLNPDPHPDDFLEVMAWLDYALPAAEAREVGTSSVLDILEHCLRDHLEEASGT